MLAEAKRLAAIIRERFGPRSVRVERQADDCVVRLADREIIVAPEGVIGAMERGGAEACLRVDAKPLKSMETEQADAGPPQRQS